MKPRGGQPILDVRAGRAVEPGLDRIADGLDADVIPVLRFENALALFAERLAMRDPFRRRLDKASHAGIRHRSPRSRGDLRGTSGSISTW